MVAVRTPYAWLALQAAWPILVAGALGALMLYRMRRPRASVATLAASLALAGVAAWPVEADAPISSLQVTLEEGEAWLRVMLAPGIAPHATGGEVTFVPGNSTLHVRCPQGCEFSLGGAFTQFDVRPARLTNETVVLHGGPLRLTASSGWCDALPLGLALRESGCVECAQRSLFAPAGSKGEVHLVEGGIAVC